MVGHILHLYLRPIKEWGSIPTSLPHKPVTQNLVEDDPQGRRPHGYVFRADGHGARERGRGRSVSLHPGDVVVVDEEHVRLGDEQKSYGVRDLVELSVLNLRDVGERHWSVQDQAFIVRFLEDPQCPVLEGDVGEDSVPDDGVEHTLPLLTKSPEWVHILKIENDCLWPVWKRVELVVDIWLDIGLRASFLAHVIHLELLVLWVHMSDFAAVDIRKIEVRQIDFAFFTDFDVNLLNRGFWADMDARFRS